MKHNLPEWVINLLSRHYTEKQVRIIDRYWYNYKQMDLSEATQGQLLRAGRDILNISGLCHGYLDV